MRVNRPRRAEEAISNQDTRRLGKESPGGEVDATVAPPQSQKQAASGLLGQAGGAQNLIGDIDVVGAEAFRPLQQLQSQTAEDLWTRDRSAAADMSFGD